MDNTRRRMRRNKGKRLQRQRSELVERSFAHVCETGGARRTWLRGKRKINKRYLMHVTARNLGLLMRDLFGIGKPRVMHGGMEGLSSSSSTYIAATIRVSRFLGSRTPSTIANRFSFTRTTAVAVVCI